MGVSLKIVLIEFMRRWCYLCFSFPEPAAHHETKDLAVTTPIIFVAQSIYEWIQAAANEHQKGEHVV